MKKASSNDDHVHLVETLSLSELTLFCDTKLEWVLELVEFGVVTPTGTATAEPEFAPVQIARARKAVRLMRDLELNVAGVALVLDLIEERDALVRKLAVVGEAI